MTKFEFFTLYLLLIRISGFKFEYIIEPVRLPSSPYASWAHSHWIWLDSEEQSQEEIINLVNEYISESIPVGAVILSSSWSLKQDFSWNLNKFPEPRKMIDYLHSLDIKVICWISSMVNEESSIFNFAKQNGYFLSDSKLIEWKYGKAAMLDYTNPKAVEWWHLQMENLLSIGIDGWQCEGSDPYIWKLEDAFGHRGKITQRFYADLYYRDFFNYTRKIRGAETLILARAIDNFEDFNFLKYAPRDVLFSGWVGDHVGNWQGIRNALDNIIHSAWNNYLNFGVNIGGSISEEEEIELVTDKKVFIRWFQLASFLPIMQNGGQGEHRPWKFDENVLSIYRLFTILHENLRPYFMSAGVECFNKKISVIKPLAHRIPYGTPSSYDYLLHNDIFVSPFVQDRTIKSIKFPAKDQWVYWFNWEIIFKGGQVVDSFKIPYEEFPVFYKMGSIIPLEVKNEFSNLGTWHSKDYITILITHPLNGLHTKNVYEFNSTGYKVSYDFKKEKNELDFVISACENKKFIILLNGINSSSMIGSVNSSGNFSKLGETSNAEVFWPEKTNLIFKPNLKQAFIKIYDKADLGLHLKLKNLNLL